MTEREIFQSALDYDDPTEQQAYLDQACGADSELRRRVDSLLESHMAATDFLNTPAVDRMKWETHADPAPTVDLSKPDFSFLQPSSKPDSLGTLGNYEILEAIGQGAFGIVFKAFDPKLHRIVAIKVMNPELATTSPPRKRFLREARTAAAVTHENIVAIHAVEEEPIPYLVMEYIAGPTLGSRMDGSGPLDVKDILKIGQQVAAGLAAAHSVNLIHRDIKPSNILLTEGTVEKAKISDFGLARAVDDASMTQSGMIAGTPMYMAPEQARGETLDHRADLFSLGSVLYQMASGRPPFRAPTTIAVLKRVCEDTPRSLDDVIPETPAWLQTIIFRLLEKNRDDRFQTAQE
ncbi:MAG: serine/threonine-protein kinase, partial [Pirellulaceae bacterium]